MKPAPVKNAKKQRGLVDMYREKANFAQKITKSRFTGENGGDIMRTHGYLEDYGLRFMYMESLLPQGSEIIGGKSFMARKFKSMDGNNAAAYVSYEFT